MEKSRIRKPQKSFVFQFFEVICGTNELGKFRKVSCKFCQWKSVTNATRMTAHIKEVCTKCPKDVRNLLLQCYGPDIKSNGMTLRPSPPARIENDFLPSSPPSNKNDFIEMHNKNILHNFDGLSQSNQFHDLHSAAIIVPCASIPTPVEKKVFSNYCLTNEPMTKTENLTIPNPAEEKGLYISDTVDITSEADEENDFPQPTNGQTIKEANSTENFVERDAVETKDQKLELKVFSDFVHYELGSIKDLEILNDLKHDICNLLYTAKKQYLKNLRK